MRKYGAEFYQIKWIVHPMRKDKRTGPTRILKRSKWANYLWEKETASNRSGKMMSGSSWNEIKFLRVAASPRKR